MKPELPLPKPDNPKKKKILALTGIAMGIGLTLTVATQTFARDVGYNPVRRLPETLVIIQFWAMLSLKRIIFTIRGRLLIGTNVISRNSQSYLTERLRTAKSPL